MTHLQQYYKVLSQLRQWWPAERITRVRNMALLMLGLYLGKSIHLAQIVGEWPVAGKIPSLVNRVRRFLDNEQVQVRAWYRPLAQEVIDAFVGRQLRLVIDTTKVGFNHRLLSVGLAYKKRVLPLAWSLHEGAKGHTSVADQLALLRYIQPWLPPEAEVWLLGDTEFQNVRLLRWLRRQGWHFVIRQQAKNKVCWSGQPWIKLGDLALQPGQTRYVGWVYLTQKHEAGPFWLILHWAQGEDEPWYLVSDQAGRRSLIRLYTRRMWIEELFGDLKGHGFDLEATHIRQTERLDRLILAVCLTFVWLITLGSWVVKRGFRHLIDHKSRRDKSYFRLGWDWLKRCMRLNQPLPLRFKPYF